MASLKSVSKQAAGAPLAEGSLAATPLDALGGVAHLAGGAGHNQLDTSAPSPALPNQQVQFAEGRLIAITRGQYVPSEIHPSIAKEDPVLEMDNFSFWYGTKKSLHEISMRVPKYKVTARWHRPQRMRQVDAAAVGQSAQRSAK